MYEEISQSIEGYVLERVQREKERIFRTLKFINEGGYWNEMTKEDLGDIIFKNRR